MEKRIVKLECLFLHDTPMAALTDEQRRVRARLAAAPGDSENTGGIVTGPRANDTGSAELPFSVLPPFFPCRDMENGMPRGPAAGAPERATPLAVGEPEASAGWILRPVSGAFGEGANVAPLGRSEQPEIPGYPALPPARGFILGYAGGRAGELALWLRETGARAFTVRLWYRAGMTVTIDAIPGKVYGAQYAIDAPRWEKCR